MKDGLQKIAHDLTARLLKRHHTIPSIKRCKKIPMEFQNAGALESTMKKSREEIKSFEEYWVTVQIIMQKPTEPLRAQATLEAATKTCSLAESASEKQSLTSTADFRRLGFVL